MLGTTELLLLGALALLVFGGKKVPEMMRGLGQGVKEFKKGMIIISDVIKPDRYYQRNIYDLTIKNDRLKNILDTFRETNIFYANDLVGTDFKQAIDFTIKK